ncbi:winged helix-turn-helix domain-containing protein [Natrialba asiatica]|uniref:Putative ArsR family transcriptional regulator n=1 Tax=Natrialba asiatica (strain ATCC 700177 / DSM 12278 / JCM 9576 / FERM P-10747 / NBRC 102637 / 172P1) TaxID=29540 RepID=M0B743_NATA1|nr:helix-turn-helix domain-containing protein [Natrialba asiatica]ELZ05459.1 putative ArsR family transcriptional regulator [Natrialba asiatica DSM 12278]
MSHFDRTVDSSAESGTDADRNRTLESASSVRTESQLLPAEVFSILGNDTRVSILQALLELGADDAPVSFTALFEEVDMQDSANFSYHLNQLTGHFITQSDGGYEFRHPGRKVVSSIFSGTLTDRAKLGFFPVDGSCYACDGSLHGWYVDDTLTIGCTDCGTIQVQYPFPTGGLDDRSPDEFLQAFHHYVRHHYCLAADGVCPECTGAVETTLVRDPEPDDQDVAVTHVCQRCGYRLQSTVGLTLLDNAEVLVFHSERGVDLNTDPFWQFDWCVSDTQTTIVSDDPLRVQLTLPCAGAELVVRLDETVSVIETAVVERSSQ